MRTTVKCPRCDSSRCVGVCLDRIYTGILYWKCEECHLRWHAYSHEADPHLHGIADVLLDAHSKD